MYPSGSYRVNHVHNDWRFHVAIKRTRRWATISIQAKKAELPFTFHKYTLERARFLSVAFKGDHYKSQGRSGVFSDLLLSSTYAINLLETKNPRLGLAENGLHYRGKIKRRDDNQILIVIILVEKLTEEIDRIISETDLSNNGKDYL